MRLDDPIPAPTQIHPASDAEAEMYARLGILLRRWQLRCMRQRAAEIRRSPSIERTPRGDAEVIETHLPDTLDRQTKLLDRLARDPAFFAYVMKQTSQSDEARKPHHRGTRYEDLRQAHLELLLRLLVKGTLSTIDFETSTMSGRRLREVLKARSRSEWYFLIEDGADTHQGTRRHGEIDARRRRRPVDLGISEFNRSDQEDWLAGAADRFDEGWPVNSLAGGSIVSAFHGPTCTVDPQYPVSLIRLRQGAIRFLQEELDGTAVDQARRRLIEDLTLTWWVLPRLFLAANVDVVTEWFRQHSPDAQRLILAKELAWEIREQDLQRLMHAVEQEWTEQPQPWKASIGCSLILSIAERIIPTAAADRPDPSTVACWRFVAGQKGTQYGLRAIASFNLSCAMEATGRSILARRAWKDACRFAARTRDAKLIHATRRAPPKEWGHASLLSARAGQSTEAASRWKVPSHL